MFATKLPKAGRARLAVMLSPKGKLKGDLTIFNGAGGTWWIMGSYYLGRMALGPQNSPKIAPPR